MTDYVSPREFHGVAVKVLRRRVGVPVDIALGQWVNVAKDDSVLGDAGLEL